MDNSVTRKDRVRHVLLRANLVFSILIVFILLVISDLIFFESSLVTKVVGKLLLPLMIAAPILTILNILFIKGSETRTRSKLGTYTVISSVATLLAILAMIAGASFSDQ